MPRSKLPKRRKKIARRTSVKARRRGNKPSLQRLETSSSLQWQLDLAYERSLPKIDRTAATKLVQALMRDLELPPPRGVRTRGHLPYPPKSVRLVSLSFISDVTMRELNRSHRKKDKPTDVLSFPSVLPGDYPELASDEVKYPLGDIVISIDTAITQAERYRWNLQSELLRLLIHGILHLLGYDHEKVSPAVANKMRRLEKTLFLRHRDSAPLLISGRASPRSTRR